MRDFQLVDENDVIPPWLLTLDVCGHTFNGRNVTHLPEVAFERKKVVNDIFCLTRCHLVF